MTIEAQRPLATYADWIRTTDHHHAAHHLELLGRAERILGTAESAPQDERRQLATKLERWRYQHLNEHQGNLGPEDLGLIDALDLAANELAGRGPRPPRNPRAAIQDTVDGAEIAEAKACLDPGVSLDELVSRASQLTRRHFAAPPAGNGSQQARQRMLLYAPLYLSNHCINHCVYCGFRHPEEIQRRHLGPDQALREAEILRRRGFRHILLVAGDFPSRTTTAYFAGMLRMLAGRGVQPAVEIAAQTTGAYAELRAAGACGVTLYQETYDESLYAVYHPRGSKASYDWRLEALERAAEAGIPRLGLGILLGLGDPRADLLAMIRHALYLRSRFPEHTLAMSLPRIHETPLTFQKPFTVDDETFVRLYCTLRVVFPSTELVLSTREPVPLRDRLARICITQMSAGSSTAPGGYEHRSSEAATGQQFPVSDHRTPAEVEQWLREGGFEVAWEITGS